MQNTIERTSGGRLNISETVFETIRSIGHGFMTVAHVTWAINAQLAEAEKITAEQVARAMSAHKRAGYMKLTGGAHGAYRYWTH